MVDKKIIDGKEIASEIRLKVKSLGQDLFKKTKEFLVLQLY